MDERIRELREEDLPALTEMWNGTDSVWPGGLTSGMPLTLDRMAQWVSNTTYIAPLVGVHEGRIVGFCGLTPLQGDRDVAYISILGVLPEVLNQGFGRDLLRAAIARGASLGYRRLDLDTWSANTRAIPLYKRTGFHWVPGTSVNMQNFIPKLLNLEVVQRFLAGGDWYRHIRPAVTLEQDKFEEGNVPVLPYLFERDGARLRLALEVSSGDLVAYEDGSLAVSLSMPDHALILERPALARVHVSAPAQAGQGRGQLTLFTVGRGGVDASRTSAVDLERSVTLEVPLVGRRPVRNAREEPQPRRSGLTALVSLGHIAVEIGCSVSVLPALEVVAEPRQVSLAPERPATFWLGVKNNTPDSVTARLQLTSCGDFQVRSLGNLDFPLEAGKSAAVQVEAVAPAGLHSLRAVPLLVTAGATQPVEAGMLEVPVVAGGPSDAYAYRTEFGAILENAYLRAQITAKGGTVRVQTKNPTQDLVEQRANLGPPFWPSEYATRDFDVQVDAREGRASVHLALESSENPGLWFRRSVTLTASPRIETEFSLVNTADRTYRMQTRVEHTMRMHSSLVAVPLSEGLLVDSAEAADWEGGARFPQCYAETWASLQREDLTVGFLWPEGSFPEFSRRFGPVFTLPEVTVGPGQTIEAGRVVLYGGTGGWRTVRDQWRRLFSPDAPEQPPAPLRAAQAGLRPSVVAWYGDPVPLEVRVRHLRGRVLNARARLDLPSGWCASATEWEVAGLRRGEPRAFNTVVRPTEAALAGGFPAADEGSLVLDANLALGRQSLALIALGMPGPAVSIVEHTEGAGRTLRVDNGWSAFVVAPEFAASVVSFERAGQNHLYSAFPNVGELMWQRPWFGGIAPVVAPSGTHFHPIHSGRLHEETFVAEFPVERDFWGAIWTGVRLSSLLTRPEGVRLEVEYLTLSGSNLLLGVVRFRNENRAPQAVQSFLGCYLRVDGEMERTVLRYLAEGEHNTRREAFDVWLAPSSDWAAIESEPTGITAALVSATPWAFIQAYSLGLEGAHLFNVGDTLLAPGASEEYVTIFALTDSPEKARRYRALGWSGEPGRPPEH